MVLDRQPSSAATVSGSSQPMLTLQHHPAFHGKMGQASGDLKAPVARGETSRLAGVNVYVPQYDSPSDLCSILPLE